MLSLDPNDRAASHPEDVEEELAAVLPQTQGSRFFPMIRGLAWHLLAFILLGAAAFILWREFRTLSLSQVTAAIRAWGWGTVALALSLSASSFVLMGFVEYLGLRWAGARVRLRTALAGSFVASAMAHSLGANLLVSGAVRARWYGRRGVSFRQVAAATLFQGFSFTVGIATLAGVCLLAAGSQEITAASRIANPVADGVGGLLVAAVGAYIALCALVHRPLRGFGHSVKLPSVRVALAQMSLGAIDNAVAAAIFWILLPAGAVDYLAFVGIYAPSVVAGLISHVPGGVGVFEGSLSTLLRGVEPAALAAAFLGYRLFFFLIPLVLAGLALVLDTLRERSRQK
ncbi:lysylphosphatidylglycerol synthase domain-containing protein [uncultured Phenylobacterium sp.]|uniref:lysylphosphatidylglycerol synthase domain-containing protein n=1 Tax=uncultured Phenylobacterium sp. TaxID=349273 RepID=UPI0025ECAB9F|nr:lysylphosphatidylglycerol synthase domain-containing protein [uncultured Phenylobacterium sp.]